MSSCFQNTFGATRAIHSMEKARELGGVPTSSSSDIWIDTTDDVNLIFEFHPRQEDMAETHCQKEIVQPQLEEESVESYVKEEKSVLVAKGRVKQPIIIDLDSYEEDVHQEPPSDMSMALVVVSSPSEVIHDSGRNPELAIVRVDTPEKGETISQYDLPCNHGRSGFNTSTAGSISERLSPGNGHTAPRPGVWEGPPRWASSHIGIQTVQCARCLKWRVVPTKEQYEAIREHILETPWVCENALQWRPDAHCDLPTDLNQDSQMLWAIDKPNLPSSPPGWSRKVIVRKDCSTKFADVYYTAPDGKSLRSMVEVAKYLEENPSSVPEGTRLDQFSYTIPQPLPGVWTAPPRKRNTIRSVVGLSNSQGKGKKARAPPPLAKQLAQRLLHGTNPPMLPVAPTFPLPSAPSFPMPYVPCSVQPLASLAPTYPPVPNFTNPPVLPLLPITLPPMRNPYPHSSTFAPTGSPALPQVVCYSSQRGMLTSSSVRQPDHEPSTTTSVSRRKTQQQKSRLGAATSLSQNENLAGILPLREPSS